MPVRIAHYPTSHSQPRVFMPPPPQQRQSRSAPAPDYGFSTDILAKALRQKGNAPHSPQQAERMLSRQPLNDAGFRSSPAVGTTKPAGLFGLGNLLQRLF